MCGILYVGVTGVF